MKIAHISDTHIRNLKYHNSYRESFKDLYNKIPKDVDCIIHTGDIAHSKTNLSPEFFSLAKEFLVNLSKIAHLYIILGNHDGLVSNATREDAITPIVSGLQNITLIKSSKEVEIEEGIVLNCLSIFDKDNWILEPTNPNKINIALHHGPVDGSKTDSGFAMKNSRVNLKTFEHFDYVLLGDIHKCQKLDKYGKIRYAGSTIQQHFGETSDKGFLVWNIIAKNEWKVDYISVYNPSIFTTIEVGNEYEENDYNLEKDSKIRLLIKKDLPYHEIKLLKDKISNEYSVKSINIAFKIDKKESPLILNKNYSYFQNFFNGNPRIDELQNLDKKYDDLIENEGYKSGVWSLISFRWDNILNFGEGNYIDFTTLNGIVGIHGKNYSGKTNFIDSIVWTIFGRITKSVENRLDILNKEKDNMKSELLFDFNNERYKITRSLKRNKKGTTSKLSLFKNGENISGSSVNKTQQAIIKIFGTYEDFLMTNYSSQDDFKNFIESPSLKRKEIISNFLNITSYGEKLKLAKEDIKREKFLIKKYKEEIGNINHESIIRKIEELSLVIEEKERKLREIEKEMRLAFENKKKVEERIKEIEVENNLERISEERMQDGRNKLKKIDDKINMLTLEMSEIDDRIKSLNKPNSDFIDSSILKKKIDQIKNWNLKSITSSISSLSKDIVLPPCNTNKFKACPFVKNWSDKRAGLQSLQKDKARELNLCKKFEADYENSLRKEEILTKYNALVLEHDELNNKIIKLNSQKFFILEKLREAEENNKKYDKNAKIWEKLEKYKEQMSFFTRNSMLLKNEVISTKTDLKNRLIELGGLKEKEVNYSKIIKLLEKLEKRAHLFKEYINAMHPNGIPNLIISDNINKINEEVNKILLTNANFKLRMVSEDKKMRIFIYQPGQQERILETGSGAERTLSSMAIRLALISISSLPKSSFFVLDEPSTSLDSDNLDNFKPFLNMIKTQFERVFLITHLVPLKEMAEHVIKIKKVDNIARIEI